MLNTLNDKMSEAAGNWCLIESDPGVFTELIQDFGVKGVQVEELWSLDAERFRDLKPVHGLIFLFKVTEMDEPSGPIVKDGRLDRIFFAKQVINNACATQAILSVLMNVCDPEVDLGPMLTNFKDFCGFFDPVLKGLTLSNSEPIRTVHNSFASQTLFELEANKLENNDDAYHFISYVPIDGRLYELDGLREGPIDLGSIPVGKDWLEIVTPVIEKRIQNYSNDVIQFNLMAVITNRKHLYELEIKKIDKEIEYSGTVDDSQKLQKEQFQQLIKEEERKFQNYRIENIRRKHNYIPLIMELMKLLAKDKELMPLYLKAKEKALNNKTKATLK